MVILEISTNLIIQHHFSPLYYLNSLTISNFKNVHFQCQNQKSQLLELQCFKNLKFHLFTH
jgi:hypothetical protein